MSEKGPFRKASFFYLNFLLSYYNHVCLFYFISHVSFHYLGHFRTTFRYPQFFVSYFLEFVVISLNISYSLTSYNHLNCNSLYFFSPTFFLLPCFALPFFVFLLSFLSFHSLCKFVLEVDLLLFYIIISLQCVFQLWFVYFWSYVMASFICSLTPVLLLIRRSKRFALCAGVNFYFQTRYNNIIFIFFLILLYLSQIISCLLFSCFLPLLLISILSCFSFCACLISFVSFINPFIMFISTSILSCLPF